MVQQNGSSTPPPAPVNGGAKQGGNNKAPVAPAGPETQPTASSGAPVVDRKPGEQGNVTEGATNTQGNGQGEQAVDQEARNQAARDKAEAVEAQEGAEKALQALAEGPAAVAELKSSLSETDAKGVDKMISELKGSLKKINKFVEEDPAFKAQLEGVTAEAREAIAKENSTLTGAELEAKINEQLQARNEDLVLEAAVRTVDEIFQDPAKVEKYKDDPFIKELLEQKNGKNFDINKVAEQALQKAPLTPDEIKNLDPKNTSKIKEFRLWYAKQPTWLKILITMLIIQIAGNALALIAPLVTVGLAVGQLGGIGAMGAGIAGVVEGKGLLKPAEKAPSDTQKTTTTNASPVSTSGTTQAPTGKAPGGTSSGTGSTSA